MPDEDPGIPVNYCRDCRLVHPPMVTCLQASAKAVSDLLSRVGQQDQCRGCLVPIFWATANARRIPRPA